METTKIIDKILEKFDKLCPLTVNVSKITGGSERLKFYSVADIVALYTYIVALREAYSIIEENKEE